MENTTNNTHSENNADSTQSPNHETLKSIFNQLKNLELDGNSEGIICIGFSTKGDDVSLVGSIQGKTGKLVQAVSEAINSDEHLKLIMQKALVLSLIDNLD